MRESVGGAWILGIVITFMAIFIAFISISINYSTAYKLKTAMVTVIEQYDGFNHSTIEELQRLMDGYGYIQKGTCRSEENKNVFGVLSGDYTPNENPTTKQSYCIRREYKRGTNNGEDKYYYTIEVFFGFNLPVLGELYTFRVNGETNVIYYPKDSVTFR